MSDRIHLQCGIIVIAEWMMMICQCVREYIYGCIVGEGNDSIHSSPCYHAPAPLSAVERRLGLAVVTHAHSRRVREYSALPAVENLSRRSFLSFFHVFHRPRNFALSSSLPRALDVSAAPPKYYRQMAWRWRATEVLVHRNREHRTPPSSPSVSLHPTE